MQTPNSPSMNVPGTVLIDLLNRNALKTVLAKARQLAEIHQLLLQAVESELAPHVRVADIHQTTLIVHANTAAWGMRLRFETSSILAQLRQQISSAFIRELQVKIRPWHILSQRNYWAKPVLSASSAAILADTASYITDEKLKNSLLRLAAKCNKKTEGL